MEIHTIKDPENFTSSIRLQTELSRMEEPSSGYSRMDTETRFRKSVKDHLKGKQKLLLLLSTASVIFILFVMVFVIFGFQERRFSMMEKFMISHNSSLNSVNSELKGKVQDTGSELQKMVSELKKSVSGLSSYVDLYTSRIQTQFSSGAQVKKLTDLQTSVNNLGTSLGSLFSKLETQLQDTAAQLSGQHTEVGGFLKLWNSSVSALTDRLQITVKQKDLAVVGDSVAALNSSLASLKSEQLKRIQDSDERVIASLKEMKADLEGRDKSEDFHNRTLLEMTKLASSLTSLSTQLQSTDQKLMTALNALKTKPETPTKPAARLSCKSGWVPYGSRCYFISKNVLDWHKARDYCRSQNSFLLTIESAEQLAFVLRQSTREDYWVGLTDENTGQWRWDDGTAYVMNRGDWMPGQPDDWTRHGLGPEGEDCAHILRNGKLNDGHCSLEKKYVCKTKNE